MNKERLNILADHMEQIASKSDHPRRLDMSLWIKNVGDDRELLTYTEDQLLYNLQDSHCVPIIELPEGFCGTAACVLGEACFISEFNEAGLKMEVGLAPVSCFTPEDGEPIKYDIDFTEVFLDECEDPQDNLFGYEAAAKFFHIPLLHASIMFGNNEKTSKFYTGDETLNPTQRDVANRLRRYIKEGSI